MFKAYTHVVIKIAKEELTPKEDMLGPLKLKTAPPSEMKGKTGILVKVWYWIYLILFNIPLI